MSRKKLCVAFIAFLLLNDTVCGKKSRKNKRPRPDEEDHTPQPSVVSYSTFGFNDVGTYEGFVPSSPDYAKFLTGVNQEPNTKEHPSSFSSSDSKNFDNNFVSQPYSGQSFNINEDGGSTANRVQYPPSSTSLFNTPSFDSNIDQHRNMATEEIYGHNTDEINSPTYGTKLNSKNKIKSVNVYNHTNFSSHDGENFSNFHETKPTYDNRPFHQAKPTFESLPSQGEYSNPFSNNPSYVSASAADNNKPLSNDFQNPLKFQRVVDFTKLQQYHSTDLDTSRLPNATPIPDLYENSFSNQNIFTNPYNISNNSNKHLFNPATKYRGDIYNENNSEDNTFEKNTFKANKAKENYNDYNSYTSGKDNLNNDNFDTENKKKMKPWSVGEHGNFKKWKEPTPSKGYEYSTNYSSMSFSYDADDQKLRKPLGSNIDELIPASSNIDVPNYHLPETDFSHFKKMPDYKVYEDDEFQNFPSVKEKYKPNEFDYNQYKNLFSTPPTTTAYWGSSIKSSDNSLKNNPFSNKHRYRDNDEIVNIPRRPNKYSENHFESKPYDWSQYHRRPHKNRPHKDWTNDFLTTRFKSEEDLLGLRNQDTSHPSYLPSYQSNNFVSDEGDYKKLVDKWRQSYWKSKYKDSLRDYESYGTETKPMHVPVPKPYPIEVPHPVIVPVPQPYPVRVPIAKPVAVPIFRELKIPIEKPMPYLVYKDVPYPVEKLVPVRVEKEVRVPVEKPYPVHIPYIRPVFHHTKSRDEYEPDHRDEDDGDDYFPRLSGNKNKHPQYMKKNPKSSRNRPRRPSRNAYQERNWWRSPDRQHPSDTRDKYPRKRPLELRHPSPFKRRNSEGTRF